MVDVPCNTVTGMELISPPKLEQRKCKEIFLRRDRELYTTHTLISLKIKVLSPTSECCQRVSLAC